MRQKNRGKMTVSEGEMLWEALEKVPKLPGYAVRAIDQLKREFWSARANEAALEGALDTVAQGLRDAGVTED